MQLFKDKISRLKKVGCMGEPKIILKYFFRIEKWYVRE